MRAAVCHEIGSFDRVEVEEVPTPEPGPGQVRLAVRAAGVSYVDGLLVAGRYQFPMQAPYVPGGEAAGVIDAVGEGVEDWQPGDRVFGSIGAGGFAELAVASPRQLVRLPADLDFARGASFLQVYGTAWFALHPPHGRAARRGRPGHRGRRRRRAWRPSTWPARSAPA